MKKLFENIFFKLGIITVLILFLLIPATMVERLIAERMDRYQEAMNEVSDSHAGEQEIIGPILQVPYVIPGESMAGAAAQVSRESGVIHILPDQLKIKGDLDSEQRKRGIFNVAVYGTEFTFKGSFSEPDLSTIYVKPEHLDWEHAHVTIGISDLKGLLEQVHFQIDEQDLLCTSGAMKNDLVRTGIHTAVQFDSTRSEHPFSFKLALNGSQSIRFAPIGKETTVHLASSWKDPSFQGNYLPTQRDVGKEGFTAEWKVLDLNRNYPQVWKNKTYGVSDSLFGVDLQLGVDQYQKSMRVAKYALLFIGLTYLVFFFVEVTRKLLIHPVQYILVGIALVLFYVLLLAFSEQISFDWAYVVSASMIITLIMLYARSMFKAWGPAMFLCALLSILYTFIFVIIQLQDFALLFGSLGIFLILATTMFFSRKIEWFEKDSEPEPAPDA